MEKLLRDLREDMVATVIIMGSVLHFPITGTESAKRIIDDAEKEDDYFKIKMIWDALQEYNK